MWHEMTIYYVNAATGSDAAAGTSVDAAWKSLAKVSASAFKPGDQILFARGQEWNGQLVAPSSGTADQPIVFGAYGSGAKPVFNAATQLGDADWTKVGTNLWSVPLRGEPSQVLLDDARGSRQSSLDQVNTTKEWFWSSGKLYVSSDVSPADRFGSVEASVQDNPILNAGKDHVVYRDLAVEKGRTGNFMLRDSEGVKIIDVDLSWSGIDGLRLIDSHDSLIQGGSSHHNGQTSDPKFPEPRGHGYAIGQEYGAPSRNVIDGVEAYANAEDGLQFGAHSGSGNVVRNTHMHHNLEDAIDFKGGSQTIENNLFENNAVKGINIGWGQGGTTGDTTLIGNVVRGNGMHALFNDSGGRIFSRGNVYDGTGGSSVAARLLDSGDGSTFDSDAFIGGTGASIRIASGTGHAIRGSVVVNGDGMAVHTMNGTDKTILTGNVLAGSGAYIVRYDGVTAVTADRNLYYRDDGGSDWVRYNSLAFGSRELADHSIAKATQTDANSTVATSGADLSNSLPKLDKTSAAEFLADAKALLGGGGTPTEPGPSEPVPSEPPASGTIAGTEGADTLKGASGADVMLGRGGDDQLVGNGGNDTMDGGMGHDRLDGGAGDDAMSGGDGNDYLVGRDGKDRLVGGDGNDTLLGGNHDDRVEGGTGDDKLQGNGGNDLLEGGAGKDNLRGHDGNDRLVGGEGNDALYGDGGADVLVAGQGLDILYGGSGGDRFVIEPGVGMARIMDFNAGQDTLDLSAIVRSLGLSAAKALDGGYVEIREAGTGTAVFVDTDGSVGAKTAAQVATLAVDDALIHLGVNLDLG